VRVEKRGLTSNARKLRADQTDTESLLWNHLRAGRLLGFKFKRQVPLAGYIADFACLEVKLIIELDGSQHAQQTEYDVSRTMALEKLGFRVMRFWNDEALLKTADLLQAIALALQTVQPSPQPSPKLGRGG
jgi:very-short-patch-repair endonuclease